MFLALKFWIFTGFLAGLSGAVNVNIRRDQYEHLSGDDIVLPCKFRTKSVQPVIIVSWSVIDNTSEDLLLTHFHPMKMTVKAQHQGRVSLDFSAVKGTANLRLSHVTPADSKIYRCRVQIPSDNEGKQFDTTRLNVYEAVSTPICKIQGKPEHGNNINLTCYSEKGFPTPLYSWKTQDVRNMYRVMDHRNKQQGGVLSLYNISRDTSGYYKCTSANKVRSASCDIALTVLPPALRQSLVLGSIAGVMTGAFASVLSMAERTFQDINANNGTGQTSSPSPSVV